MGPGNRLSNAEAMFIRHNVHVEQPVEVCRRELLEPPERWVPDPIAGQPGARRFLVKVGLASLPPRIGKQVELTVGPPEVAGQWVTVPVAWHATGPSGLFPVLEGKLTVQPIGPRSSMLSVSGWYEPPLGALGRGVDHALLHSVAEATVGDFVERVAARLSTLAAEGATEPELRGGD